MSHVQVASIASALLASGGIAALTFFDVPELQPQPASRSLPAVRWLFSRGSHVFPSAALLSTAGLIYAASGSEGRGLAVLSQPGLNSSKANGLLLAAGLVFSIVPTTWLMLPTNFALIEENNRLGGARSRKAAGTGSSSRSALDSVAGKGEGDEFTDLSGPQERAEKDSTPEQDERVRQLLEKFRWMNLARAVLIGAGGVVGLYTVIG